MKHLLTEMHEIIPIKNMLYVKHSTNLYAVMKDGKERLICRIQSYDVKQEAKRISRFINDDTRQVLDYTSRRGDIYD